MLISKSISNLFLFLILFSIFISIFFIPILCDGNFYPSFDDSEILDFNPDGFVWPIPGYTRISSPFGKRNHPTNGVSSFHYGCDIPAPEGTKLIAVSDGIITFRSFLGPGGFTITLSFDSFKVSYCHVDPHFLVSVGDTVKQGQVIALVGPKNVYGVPGNSYTDEKGLPTNGASTGPHLHLGVRLDNEYKNPLFYF